ncbi:MAG TPA: DNRLRE domain-containing protein [Polyangiaceae bacterium]|nr:DNRLRE domain-containing protein [Polyangiaceae bacterium]
MRKLSQRTLTGVFCLGAPLLALAACSGDFAESEDYGSQQQALVTVTATFQEGVAAYAGSTDATIRQASATSNSGSTTKLEADGDDGSGVDLSALLRWTLTGVPTDATVTAASITLQVTNSSSNTYNLYAVSRSWNEAQVTWNNAATGSAWATPGALGASDRGAVVGSVTGSTGSRTITLNAAGIAMVQGWVSGANNGVIIASASNTDGIDFASSEASTASQRPKLSITYTTNVGGGTGGSGSGGSGTGGSSAGSSGAGTAGSAGSGGVPTGTPQPNVLIAFMGDQGVGTPRTQVLNLIKNEGAVATVHNGDFDYANDPTNWDNAVTSVLGANYPYFAIIGNHDAAAWGGSNGYAAKIAARVARVPEMNCTGELGARANCNFRGVHLIQSCVGVSELRSTCNANAADQVGFIQSSLAASSAPFKICNWHKNQNDMQTGSKGNEVGWQPYQACINAGAIVSTGHEHSYERTGILTDIGNASTGHGIVASGWNNMSISPGRSFVFVSGLGGVEIRDFEASHNTNTWWATTYASNRWYKNGVTQTASNITYGALFVRFHDGGNVKRAVAYFKDLNGRLVDEFTIEVP